MERWRQIIGREPNKPDIGLCPLNSRGIVIRSKEGRPFNIVPLAEYTPATTAELENGVERFDRPTDQCERRPERISPFFHPTPGTC